jgi:tetratricopeptide (TPR) repeat protein
MQVPAAVDPSNRSARLWPSAGVGAHAVAALVLGAVVLAAYSNTIQPTGFALDNSILLLQDPRLQGGEAERIGLIFTQDYWFPTAVSGLYRPLTTLTYWLDYYALDGRDVATGYHAVNFALHWLDAVLVYFVALAVLQQRWLALAVAALFGVHPIATESVTNIIGRSDLLAGASVLAGFLFHLKSTTCDGRRKLPWLLGLMLVTGVGVFCKESAVVVLPVIALYDFTWRWRGLRAFARADLWAYAALVPPFAALFWVRSRIYAALPLPEFRFVDNPLLGADWLTAKLTAIEVIGKSLGLLFWPLRLSADYSYDQIPLLRWPFTTGHDVQGLLAAAFVLALAVHALLQVRRHPSYFFFAGFFFVTLLPTANLLRTIGSIMAERFLYLPLVGFAGCVVIAVHAACDRLAAPRLVAHAVLVVLVALCGVRTFVRNFDWTDDLAIWSSAVAASPDSFKTHISLSRALHEQLPASGPERAAALDRVIAEGEAAAAILDKRPLPLADRTTIVPLLLGAYYRNKGEDLAERTPDGQLVLGPESAAWYEKSIQVLEAGVQTDRAFDADYRRRESARGKSSEEIANVGNQDLYWNLGTSYQRLGRDERALDAFRYMSLLTPANPEAYLSIATLHLERGALDQARVPLLQVLLLDNQRSEASALLIDAYRRTDAAGCAVRETDTELKLDPACPVVRADTCNAVEGLRDAFASAKQRDAAEHLAALGESQYGCPREGAWIAP